MFVYIMCVIVHIIYSIIYMPIFVDLAIFREVDDSHLLAILKNTAINLDLQNALQTHRFSILLGTNSEVQLLTHMVIIFLNLKKKSYVVSHSSCMHHFTFQLAVQNDPNFPTFLMFALFFCVCLV